MKKKFIVSLSLFAFLSLGLTFNSTVKADDYNSDQSYAQTQNQKQSEQEQNQNRQAQQQSSNTLQNGQRTNQNKTSNYRPQNNKPQNKPVKKYIPKNGWVKSYGKQYYYQHGKKVTGSRKIGRSWYLFDQKGQRRFSNTSTRKAYYWVRKGKITGIKNNAKVICQRPQMPTGCEITAVTMMINFAGKKVSKYQAARIMPRSSNPNKGFIGSPYRRFPFGYWVAPGGVKPVVKHYLHHAQIMTRCSLTAIKNKLLQSHLVVVWVGWFDGFSNHALTLTGFHGNILYYNDPWTGTKRAMTIDTFKRHWALDGHRAISY